MKNKISRWHILFFQYLKRDWKKMIIWILAIGLFSAAYVPAFVEISKDQGLIGMYEVMQNPAMTSMVGPTPVETSTAYTLGAMYAHTMLLFCALFAMIVSILHVIGHTRQEEELGITEMVRSFPIGRQANAFAVLLQTLLINLIMSVFIAVVMISFNVETIDPAGALLFGLSIGTAGIMGAVIALSLGQIMPTSSGARGASLGFIGLLYILRAGTDVSNQNLSMLNPMGWTYLTNPFTENNWLPLLFALSFIVLLTLVAFKLEASRDMGAGYLPEKSGREPAKKSLLSVQGLFIKINKNLVIAWLVTYLIMGAAYGSIYGDMGSFIESNDLIKQMFMQTGVSLEASFTGTIMMVLISLVSILPIAIINRLYASEKRLKLSQLYATKITRKQVYWTTLFLSIATGFIGILAASLGLGLTALSVMEASAPIKLGDFIVAGFNFLPSVLFFIGLSATAFGWKPRLGKLTYAYLGYSFAINYFNGILNLPEWLSKSAIQSWFPRMPMEAFKPINFVIISLISISLIVFGYFGYIKRDLDEGA